MKKILRIKMFVYTLLRIKLKEIEVSFWNMNKKRNKKLLVIVVISFMLISCKNKKLENLNSFEKKVYESLLIAKPNIPNFNNSSIRNVYNLIEDKEYFALIEIGDKWYVLAIDDYDESDGINMNKNAPAGLLLTLKGKKGDIAEAVDMMVDMAMSGIKRYNATEYNSVVKINEALGLKVPEV